MSTGNQAEELAEQTLDAVASVRLRLGRAVETAQELDDLLRQTETSVRELPVPPQTELSENERALVLLDANQHGREIGASVQQSEIQVAALREQLASAAAAVTQANGFLDELDELSGQRPGTAVGAGPQVIPADLRQRLTQLETAIATAETRAGRTEERLGNARGRIAPLIKLHGDYDNRAMSSVYEASSAVTKALSGIQAGVGTTSAAHTSAAELTTAAEDLAAAVRAASNPTSRSDRQTTAASSEQDHRDRTGTSTRGPGLSR